MLVWIHQHADLFRRALSTASVLLAMGWAWAWVYAPSGELPRNLINRAFVNYDGCRCEECIARYLVIPPPRRGYGCRPPPIVDSQDALAWGSALGSLLALGLARGLPAYARRAVEQAAARAHRCPACGYSRAGLPTARCPECGTHLPA